jgi:hypothetical protein
MSGIACMVTGCRKELALLKVSDTAACYECKGCGATQYAIEGKDGLTRWMLGSDASFNSWVHGTVT